MGAAAFATPLNNPADHPSNRSEGGGGGLSSMFGGGGGGGGGDDGGEGGKDTTSGGVGHYHAINRVRVRSCSHYNSPLALFVGAQV